MNLKNTKAAPLRPFDFQENAVAHALTRSRSYLALDPGLGKTICAALLHLKLERQSMVYVCPPFLMGNVSDEFKKWCPNIKISRMDGGEYDALADLVLVADSILARPENVKAVKALGAKSYVLIVDEAHRFKALKAKRTKALFFCSLAFHKVVFMSGTPMPNRPIELWPVLRYAAHDIIHQRNYVGYGIKYCAGWKSNWGWDFSGASNFKELAANLKKDFMLRIRKSEVLKELPPKTEGLVFFDAKTPPRLSQMESKFLSDLVPSKIADVIGNEHLSTYRKDRQSVV
jgi:SWI/SNF-related matrix-associated actin-dependent regulator 1 of chromatin subfamily A